ncbi:MAG: hypothetical protein RLZZ511_2519 [Cyanobacteriota bacterium]
MFYITNSLSLRLGPASLPGFPVGGSLELSEDFHPRSHTRLGGAQRHPTI